MIETYVFLAMFALQILAMSVLFPAWIAEAYRAQAANFPADRLAALYPGVDYNKTLERRLAWHRVLSAVMVVFGLLLIGWLFNTLQQPVWDVPTPKAWVNFYGGAQALATSFLAIHALKYNKLLEPLRERKRKATLRRRGLFDFVSPFAVFLAVLSYFVFAAYMIYVAQNTLSELVSVSAYSRLIAITLAYVVYAFMVYKMLYSKRANPLEAQATRTHEIGFAARILIYSCIVFAVFSMLSIALAFLDLPRWRPVLASTFWILLPLLAYVASKASPQEPEVDEGFSGDINQQPSQSKVVS